MQTIITNWGNSLAFRIPNHITKALGLHKGSKVKINVENKKIVIEKEEVEEDFFTKLTQGEPTLKELASKVTPENIHDFSEFNSNPIGKEVW